MLTTISQVKKELGADKLDFAVSTDTRGTEWANARLNKDFDQVQVSMTKELFDVLAKKPETEVQLVKSKRFYNPEDASSMYFSYYLRTPVEFAGSL